MYTSRRGRGPARRIPQRNRAEHAARLQQRLEEAWHKADERKAVSVPDRHGLQLEVRGEPGYDLVFKSLEDRGSGILLLNVRTVGPQENPTVLATVYMPDDQRGRFLRKITQYAQEETAKKQLPKNAPLIESVSDIRLAVLESFWMDTLERLPGDEPSWVEAWLLVGEPSKEQTLEQFRHLLDELGIEKASGEIDFPERTVVMIQANRDQLRRLIEASDNIAELRRAKELATYFLTLENVDQVEAARSLLSRTTFDQGTDVSVCILDHGVNNNHLLLQPVLAAEDCLTVNPAWGTHDHHPQGHGTAMAGVCCYGDLAEALQHDAGMIIGHRLESSKILPPPPSQNDPNFWGYYTAQGVSLAEIQAPGRRRVICLPVACEETQDRGRPTSWSGALDNLASGAEDGQRRLIVVSGGNVDDSGDWLRYPESNKTKPVHDPGQSWNALTVGAYTDKVRITDPTMRSWVPIAPEGGLSPYSSTSLEWDPKWPIKPEVLFEGGNIARGPRNQVMDHEDLKLLSTSHLPMLDQFAPFFATSAAAAQAARMAAILHGEYPIAWPETVRALIVHSATWTKSMMRQFLRGQARSDFGQLLRTCGYGVPNLDRALYCAENSLTLISQAQLQPFDQREGRHVTRDMHYYDLPWPLDELRTLQETKVSMRVTLSYFIEPGPGEVGWKDRYRYPSFGLRFAVKNSLESAEQFILRVNAAAREDDERPETRGPTDKWLIGEQTRNRGSIHSDIWRGTAQELAESGQIIVYPMVGWWRERAYLNKWNKACRYSLVVSIHTPPEMADIYTPVAIKIGSAVPVEIPTRG